MAAPPNWLGPRSAINANIYDAIGVPWGTRNTAF